MAGNLRACEVEFRIESHTANLSSWFARIQRTHTFLTRESVVAALTDTDWLILDEEDLTKGYDPEAVFGEHEPFYATPAMPIHATVRRQVTGAHLHEPALREKAQEHLLAYGTRELITPGSRFRALLWGRHIPSVEEGQVHFIAKERAAIVIEKAEQHSPRLVEKGKEAGARRLLPAEIEVFKSRRNGEEQSEYEKLASAARAIRVVAETERYIIATAITDQALAIGGYGIPVVVGVTL